MRHLLIELGHVALGLAAVALITWGAGWAYPVGAYVIHRLGLVAFAVVILINLRALRTAWVRDKDNG